MNKISEPPDNPRGRSYDPPKPVEGSLVLISEALREEIGPVSDAMFRRGLRFTFLDRENLTPAVVRRVSPDLLLLSLESGDEREVTLCRELKRDDSFRNLPVIFVCSEAGGARRVSALRSGAVDVLDAEMVPRELLPRMESQLALYQVHSRVRDRLQQQSAELEQARRVQELAIPQPDRLERISDEFEVQVSTYFEPSEHLGGDFFELFSVDSGRMGGYLADFSGQGVQAALHTFSLRTFSYRLAEDYPIKQVLREINRFYCELLPEEQFLALNLFQVSPRTGEFRVWFQGGPQMFLVPASGGEVKEYHLPNSPIAMRRELELEEFMFRVEPGDTVLMLSDGVLEAHQRHSGRTFSEVILERLVDLSHLEVDALVDEVVRQAEEFAAPTRVDDDKTGLAIRF